jgi:hypothetical protein
MQKLDLILISEENKNLKKELCDTNKSIVFINHQYEALNESIKATKINPSHGLNKFTNEENENLKDKLAELEDRSRRNNLRFEGIDENEGETWEKSEEIIKNFVREKLDIKQELNIERAHRTGKRENEKGNPRKRTIVVKFLNYKEREMILEKYKKMKLWNDHVYVNEDFSERTISTRKQLFAEAKVIRATGKYAKVVYNKIITKS